MEPVELLLVGCGVMGLRHVRGYAALERVRPGSLRLRAVCDLSENAAARVAAEAEALLGYRPAILRTVTDAIAAVDFEAADVVTEPSSHLPLATELLHAGVHVQIEKPLAVTVDDCRAIAAAGAEADCVVAVAENYRRDPMNRLLKHVIESGAIGNPQFLFETHVLDGRKVMVSPWRHDRRHGGIALDMGVHYADIILYLMGPVASVWGQSMKVRETREWAPPGESPRQIPVECDDVHSALLVFESGAHGVWVDHFGGAGERLCRRSVHGSLGGVWGPPDRTGAPVRLERDGRALEGEALLAETPGFRLTGVEALLFGERPASCALPSADYDAALIALETADFLDAAREGREPEVTAAGAGTDAVELVHRVLKSSSML
jgi:predicted dehydrogenase